MRVPGRRVVTHAFRWLRSRTQRGLVVLGYHRIAENGEDPFHVAVAPSRFEAHMAVLARTATPISLQDAVTALARGAVPSRAVVVTFDDGYADNLHVALPVLERYQIPATFFIATGFLGREFWWDEVQRLFSGEGRRPRGGHGLRAVAARLVALAEPERTRALEELRSRREPLNSPPQHRALTSAELVRLAASPHASIGAHSRSHPRLASLPAREQAEEVRGSRADLEAIIGRPVTSFAYPNGSLSRRTLAVVREAGFTIACSSRQDLATPASELLALPRFWVRDVDGEKFARWIARWLRG